ncbi:hypothetical protein ACKWTF_004232 [Chironomus riparius]
MMNSKVFLPSCELLKIQKFLIIFSLQSGGYAIGIFNFLKDLSIMTVILLNMTENYAESDNLNFLNDFIPRNNQFDILKFLLLIFYIRSIIDVLLIVGIYSQKPEILVPTIFTCFSWAVMYSILGFTLIFFDMDLVVVIGGVLLGFFYGYKFSCIYSIYFMMHEGKV